MAKINIDLGQGFNESYEYNQTRSKNIISDLKEYMDGEYTINYPRFTEAPAPTPVINVNKIIPENIECLINFMKEMFMKERPYYEYGYVTISQVNMKVYNETSSSSGYGKVNIELMAYINCNTLLKDIREIKLNKLI